MLEAILWGLVAGATEFLPVSSTGHLVLITAVLETEAPDPALLALLRLATLVAVIAAYRADIVTMARFDRTGRRLLTMILIATIPAAVAWLALRPVIERVTDRPKAVAALLVVTGIVLLATMLLRFGDRTMRSLRPTDSLVVGVAEAFSLAPGLSRSGLAVSSSLARGTERVDAARFAFLLGIPVIAAGSISSALEANGGLPPGAWAGALAALAVGYGAITLFVRVLGKVGLSPFGIYCVIAGAMSYVLL